MKDHTDRTFIFVSLVVGMLLLLHLLPPISIGNAELRPVSILSDLTESKQIATDHSDMQHSVYGNDQPWPKDIYPILDFSKGGSHGMSHFYASLDSLDNKATMDRPVRIAFYGDSFIEGDLLVADLREMMQRRYGGGGVGWVDAGNELSTLRPTIENHFTGLTEYMVMHHHSYKASLAGLSERYYSSSPHAQTNFVAKNSYPHAARWSVATLYLRAKTSVIIGVKEGERETTRLIGASEHIQHLDFPVSSGKISYTVHSGMPTLFGVAMEGNNGIIIDNFSMRGSSGISLATLPAQTLKDFAQLRPYDLIIFEYGVNAVSEKSTSEDLKWYMRNMQKVINHYKSCFPNTSILLMGAPDRGVRRGSRMGTMNGIDELVEKQRQLAERSGIGYYNLFEAMGGSGSMSKMVDQGFASKDYTHLKQKGGEALAHIIYESLTEGHRRFRLQSGEDTFKHSH